MEQKTRKIPVGELILDWNLWPRHSAETLDSTNLTRMKEAIKAGIELPPVIADEKSLRIVDGFHRVSAYQDIYGPSFEIPVILKAYPTDAEMFKDAAMLNAQQGLPLGPKDKAHVLIRARRMHIPIKEMARLIGLGEEAAKYLIQRRTAIAQNGSRIPVGAGAEEMVKALNGKKMNSDQEHFARVAGMRPQMYARMLISALKADEAMEYSASTVAILRELKTVLDSVLKRVAK